MYDEGYTYITNNDLSPSCIKHMKEKNEMRAEMEWEVMDIRDMSYGDNTFDMILDKATLDTLCCSGVLDVTLMLKEC